MEKAFTIFFSLLSLRLFVSFHFVLPLKFRLNVHINILLHIFIALYGHVEFLAAHNFHFHFLHTTTQWWLDSFVIHYNFPFFLSFSSLNPIKIQRRQNKNAELLLKLKSCFIKSNRSIDITVHSSVKVKKNQK